MVFAACDGIQIVTAPDDVHPAAMRCMNMPAADGSAVASPMVRGGHMTGFTRQAYPLTNSQVASRETGVGRLNGRHHTGRAIDSPRDADERITLADAIVVSATGTRSG